MLPLCRDLAFIKRATYRVTSTSFKTSKSGRIHFNESEIASEYLGVTVLNLESNFFLRIEIDFRE